MKKLYHRVFARFLGYVDPPTINYYFPVDEVMDLFIPIKKQTLKNNNRWYDYTAYDYNGRLHHSIRYMGVCEKTRKLKYIIKGG